MWVEIGLYALALAIGAYTFVPSTLRRLAQGKIGVGTLMTIAAIGAVILGEVGEAAMLAFLFSISEGLEEYSLARDPPGTARVVGAGARRGHRPARRRRNHHPASGVAGR